MTIKEVSILKQVHRYFHIKQTAINHLNEVPNGLNKLSVITPKPNELLEAMSFEEFILTHFSRGNEFWACSRDSEDLVVFDLYANDEFVNGLLDLVKSLNAFDYVVWPKTNVVPELLVFDMDSTFIQIEVIDELAKRHKVGEQVAKVTEAAMRGELDFAASLISRVSCLKGLSEEAIAIICNQLPLSKGVEQLVESCHQNNVKIAIVSGGFTPFVAHLKGKMNLYQVEANQLEVKDGYLTGQVVGSIVDAKAKADFVLQLTKQLNISTDKVMSIGDGANDLAMMKEAGFSLAYRAKPMVQEKALGRMNVSDLNHLIKIFNW